MGVTENQRVKAGDLLYRIDPAPYRIALMQADAAVANARLQVDRMASEYRSREADIGAMASDVELAAENFRRQSDLLDRGFTTRAASMLRAQRSPRPAPSAPSPLPTPRRRRR